MRLFCAILALGIVHSLYFHFDEEPLCLSFIATNRRMHFTFEAYGQQSNDVVVKVVGKYQQIIHQFSEPKGSIEFNGDADFDICYSSSDGSRREVLMDLWKDTEDTMRRLASKTEFYELHKELAEANSMVRAIAHEEKFQQKREETHSSIILHNEQIIRTYSYAKMVTIVVVVTVQLAILRKLLTGENIRKSIF